MTQHSLGTIDRRREPVDEVTLRDIEDRALRERALRDSRVEALRARSSRWTELQPDELEPRAFGVLVAGDGRRFRTSRGEAWYSGKPRLLEQLPDNLNAFVVNADGEPVLLEQLS